MKKNLIFLTSTTGIGGEVIILTRLIEKLLLMNKYNIYCYDLKNAPFLNYIRNQKLDVQILNYTLDYKGKVIHSKNLPKNGIIILNILFLYYDNLYKTLNSIMQDTTKLLFYSVEPSLFSEFKKVKKKFICKRLCLKNLLNIANKNSALIYQDYPNYKNFSFFANKLEKRYLPMPTSISLREDYLFSKNNLHFCYIGRAIDTKITTLKFFIKLLESYKKKHPDVNIHLTVVSNLDRRERYNIKSNTNSDIKLSFFKFLSQEKLNILLKNEIDICLGNGVALLDAAKNGIISISGPASLKEIGLRTKVNLISDFQEYSLGGYINSSNKVKNKYLFSDLVDKIRNNYNYMVDKQSEFIKLNFSIENVIERFIKYLEDTTLELKEICNVERQ